MITISYKMEEGRDILLRSYLKENIKDKNHLTVNYDLPNEQQTQIQRDSIGNVRRALSKDDGTSYIIKKARFGGMEER